MPKVSLDPDVQRLLRFLSALSANNDRRWFADHRAEYDYLWQWWNDAVQRLIDRVAQFDDEAEGLQARDCVFRIYRDIRFSPDKRPYKDHFGAAIGRGGRQCKRSSYYLHISPGECHIVAGIWSPDTHVLTALRRAIDDNFDEWRSIVEAPEFAKRFEMWGRSLKTAPKGFDKASPALPYLRMKEYCFDHRPEPAFFTTDWIERVASLFKMLKPMNDFLNFTLDEEL